VDRIDDAATVAAQYRTESRLETRRSVWQPSPDGLSPHDVVAAAVRRTQPDSVLEVGCGTGRFAEQVAAENPQAEVIATDASPRFVELAAGRGLVARTADVQELPFDDDRFDVVVAMWMLYHVPDLDRGLAEIRRVLRPDGLFVAVTNGQNHLAQLLTEAGGAPLVTGFSTENGRAALARHFGRIEQEDIVTRAVFDSHADACAYLATFDERLAAGLPFFDGPRDYAGATSVFCAS